jgi:tyrosyl-DNA phosphodiesterase 2
MAAASAASLRIITWNVWFGELEAANRWEALLEETLAEDPDVVCLQEVTEKLHTLMSKPVRGTLT